MSPHDRPEWFAEPWQARLFALVVRLHEGNVFAWTEWTRHLADALQSEDGYRAWLSALENLLAEKHVVSESVAQMRRDEWHEAAKCTPHGQPILLKRRRSS